MKDSVTASSSTTQPPSKAQSRWTPESPHRALRMALASASLLSLAAGAPLVAGAAGAVPVSDQSSASTSGVYVTILSPNPSTSLAGVKQVEIKAYYESSFGVSGVDLYIDGKKMASQQLAKPEERGEISFLVAASALREGAHSIVVRATATDQEVSSARAEISLPAAASAPEKALAGSDFTPETTIGGPSIGIISPVPSARVTGIVEIKVDASDASGKAPYVSLFVDHQFKTLRNFAPYTFDLDTTHLTNGKHTVEVWGYNDAQKVTHAKAIDIIVNNPGGHTFERHDLLDDSSAPARTARAGAEESSHSPASVRAHSHAFVAASHHAAGSEAPSRNAAPPSIAHTARKALSQIIAKADRLASLGSTAGMLDSAGQNETAASAMTAPAFAPRGISSDAFETRTFAAPTAPKEIVRSHSVVHKLQASRVPSLRAARQAPAIASLNPGTGDLLIAAATKLETVPSGALDTGSADDSMMPGMVAASMQQTAPARPMEQPKIKLLLHATPVTAKPVQIASSNLGLGSDKAANAVRQAIHAATPQTPASSSHAEAERHAVIKAAAKKSHANLGRHSTIVLADFRPHDVAALRGAAEIMVNDRSVALNQPLQDRGTMLFAPIRQIIEQQGGTLEWNSATRQVTATTAKRSVTLTIGSRTATVNNQAVRLNSAPYLYNDHTMLPLDFFQKALNAKVSYDSGAGHLLIQSK